MKTGRGCFGLYWLSLARLRRHQMKANFRLLHPDDGSWMAGYDRLNLRKKETLARASKLLAATVSLTLIAVNFLSSPNSIVILLGNEITVSTVAICYLASILLFVAVHQMQTFYQLMRFSHTWSKRITLRQFDDVMYGFLSGVDNIAPSFPMTVSVYFRFGALGQIMSYLVVAMILIMLAPIAWTLLALCNLQLKAQFAQETSSVEATFAILGIFANLATITYVLLFNCPLPARKNTKLIRWIFLHDIPVSRDQSVIDRWLSK